MKLHSDWKRIVRKAWSFRFMVFAAALSGFEVALPFYADQLPRGLFASLSGIVVVAAMISRLMAQKEFEH